MTAAKHRRMVKQILKEFDWDKVERIMWATKWVWANGTVPSVKEMKDCASNLLDGIFEHGYDAYTTGGFEAFKYGNGSYGLRFVAAEWVIEED